MADIKAGLSKGFGQSASASRNRNCQTARSRQRLRGSPQRWVVERTFTWLNRCRRLAKEFENLTRNALAFLRLASIRLMLRKLCNQ
jgi:transposase